MVNFLHFGSHLVNLKHLDLRGFSAQNCIYEAVRFLPDSITHDRLSISSNWLQRAPSYTELLLGTSYTKRAKLTVVELTTIRKDVDFRASELTDDNTETLVPKQASFKETHDLVYFKVIKRLKNPRKQTFTTVIQDTLTDNVIQLVTSKQ